MKNESVLNQKDLSAKISYAQQNNSLLDAPDINKEASA